MISFKRTDMTKPFSVFFGYITFSIPPWWASYFLVIIGEMGGFEDCHVMPLPPVCCMFILLVIIP